MWRLSGSPLRRCSARRRRPGGVRLACCTRWHDRIRQPDSGGRTLMRRVVRRCGMVLGSWHGGRTRESRRIRFADARPCRRRGRSGAARWRQPPLLRRDAGRQRGVLGLGAIRTARQWHDGDAGTTYARCLDCPVRSGERRPEPFVCGDGPRRHPLLGRKRTWPARQRYAAAAACAHAGDVRRGVCRSIGRLVPQLCAHRR
jgi:hypothetical protein